MDSLADIRWGKNKDNLPLEQTNEVVVYTLSSHMPAYYRTFPGNMPDSRSIDVILTDLENAGFKSLVLITDRGYDTIESLENIIASGQATIMCAKTGQKQVMKIINDLSEFAVRPEEMAVEPQFKLYYKQYDIDYEVRSLSEVTKKIVHLKVNLYFDPIRRSRELLEIDIAVSFQKTVLEELISKKSIVTEAMLKREFCYYKVEYDLNTNLISSFSRKDKMIAKAIKLSGFFSIITHGVEFDAIKTLTTYRLRDEQEKYFQQMKDQMVADRQRNWSEEGKTGRLFILFVSLILSSYLRHVWKTTNLKDKFTSSLEVLDEMKPIRCIENDSKMKVTPFIGKQVDICETFGFEIPEGCAPKSALERKQKGKRGRPPKKKTEDSF